MSKQQEESKDLDYPVATVLADRNKLGIRYHYFPVGEKVFVVGNSDFSPPETEMMKCIPYDEKHRANGIHQNIDQEDLEYI